MQIAAAVAIAEDEASVSEVSAVSDATHAVTVAVVSRIVIGKCSGAVYPTVRMPLTPQLGL